MRKSVFILAFMLTCSMGLAQQPETKQEFPYIRNQINVNIGRIKDTQGMMNHEFFFGYMSSEVMYGINDWLETGVFCSCLRLRSGEINNNQGRLYYPLVLNYGLAAKAHLFPAIINPSFSWADLYASAQIGTFANTTGGDPERKFSCFRGYSLRGMLGAGVNFSRHFGLFYEFGYCTYERFNHRIGLNVRFGGPKKWQNPKQ